MFPLSIFVDYTMFVDEMPRIPPTRNPSCGFLNIVQRRVSVWAVLYYIMFDSKRKDKALPFREIAEAQTKTASRNIRKTALANGDLEGARTLDLQRDRLAF